jgi:hypothetical protein
MFKELHPERINALEISLGLKEKSSTELFYENPCERTLRKVSKRIQTPEMVQLAVENDGIAIKSVSKKLISEELCEIAIRQNGLALSYIPESILKIYPYFYDLAVENTGLAIEYVPKECITPQMAFQAVSQKLSLKYDFQKYPISFIPKPLRTEELLRTSIRNSPDCIKDIPESELSKDLYYLALSGNGAILKIVPSKYKDKEMITAAIASEPLSMEYVPQSKLTKKLCVAAFKDNPFVLKWIPEKFITRDMCLTVIEESCDEDRSKQISLEWFPDIFRNDRIVIDALVQKIGVRRILGWNQMLIEKIKEYGEIFITTTPLSEDTINYLHSIAALEEVRPVPLLKFDEVETPSANNEATLIKAEDNEVHAYDLTITDDSTVHAVYYITDLHLDHQLKDILVDGKIDYEKISSFLDEKIQEMLSSIQGSQDYLLIGGDVGHTKGLVTLFYRKLLKVWNGTIISVLGNHELWDNHPGGAKYGYISRPLNEIVDDYRNRINFSGWRNKSILLQNEVYINYKNRQGCIISEEQILNASEDDLRNLLLKSVFIILGGIGFSGFNQRFNAKFGLYSSAVTTIDEDRALSNQFKRVYDKINRCAGDMQVIVLTHTPIYDWSNEPVNPNWVYINGHTHQNSLIRKQDGTTILSDNQVGYQPSKWKLNSFTISGWYDPFRSMNDGIHRITSEQYRDFNLGRGIQSNGCNYPGTIYALKRNNMYMFLLQSASSLCLLAGGQRKRINNLDVYYYYDNMEKYAQKVQAAVSPYQSALHCISREIKSIGGWGSIHGCIVDIDFFNHIYLNPFDGKITPYYAWDISSRLIYDDLPALLKAHVPQLKGRFESSHKKGSTPILSQYAVAEKKQTEKMALATVSQLVLGTEIYEPSRIMKSIQYIFDNNIIRIWNDDILSTDFDKDPFVLSIEDKDSK